MSRRPVLCFVLLIIVNIMWAFQFSGAKIATERLGPTTVTFIPMALATILLAPMLWLERRRERPEQTPRAWRPAVRDFVLLAVFGCVPAQICLVWGVKNSLASNASVLTLTIPVLTALVAVALLGERMTLLRWVSFVLALAGVLMVSDIEWGSVDLLRGHYLWGNVLIFLSCAGSAFYNAYSKKVLERFSPVEVLVYSFLVADAILLVLVLAFEPPSVAVLAGLGARAWLSLLLIAAFSLAVSMVLFFWVIQRIEVTQASLSIYMLPVFGVLLSSLTLHEGVTMRLLLGGSLVFLSTFLVTTYEERNRARAYAEK
jgi:drug/metabolite transporter (DMT)-like permease